MVWEGVATTGKFCNFHSHLSLETVFVALSQTQELLCKYKNLLILKTGYLIINWVFLSLLILCPKDYLHNLTKYETEETSKILISQLGKLEKMLKCNRGLYSKNPVAGKN